MNLDTTTPEIDYPETDGRPIGETEWHVFWTFRLRELVKQRYRNQRVLITTDMFVYYEEGSPSRNFAADAMVVKDCDPRPRRIYKIWEEGRVPNVVFELVSAGTKKEDLDFKPVLYERLGIAEYFLYDPLGEQIRPQLQGYRLMEGTFDSIRPDSAGRLHSEELGLWLRVEDGDLIMYDAATGEKLLTEAEAKDVALQAAEAEVRRLREELRRHGLAE
jgi:Uma2 family endonuclease